MNLTNPRQLASELRYWLNITGTRSRVTGGTIGTILELGKLMEMPPEVIQAANNIRWVVATGRLPAEAELTFRRLSDWRACNLVAEVAVRCSTPAETPNVVGRFLGAGKVQ